MKRLSQEPWFDKKTNWGMRPVTWQGWFCSLLFVLIMLGLLLLTYINPQYVWYFEIGVVILIILFLITIQLSSDSSVKK